ncbi:MAG: FMN-binding protein [Clostridia bacterium]|nr:FMN-binding protein [Clostridia bacterium]
MKKSILIPILSIALAAVILFAAAAGLSGIRNSIAHEEHLQIMQTVLPGSASFTREAYSGDDANIRSVHRGENGFVVETVTAGYNGDIVMLVGVSNAGKVTGLVVRQMSETFGLGANALTDADFLAQFLNTSGNVAIAAGADAASFATTVEDSAEAEVTVDAISGATVTSKAIARSVNSAVAYVTGADVSSAATSWGG